MDGKLMRKLAHLSIAILLAATLLRANGVQQVIANSNPGGLLLVSDNFTRANAGTLGGNWSQGWSGTHDFGISSNTAINEGGGVGSDTAYWSANVFTTTQFSKATFQSTSATDEEVCVNTAAAAVTAYCAGLRQSIDSTHYLMFVESAGSLTQLGSTTAVTVTPGDIVEIDHKSGNSIVLIVNGSTLLTVTDSSVSSGSPGIHANFTSNIAMFNLWSGGNL